MYKKISILIPVFNEKETIRECLNKVLNSKINNLELEVIISDNNSTDGTREILKRIDDKRVKIFFREKNNGKGANIKNALKEANGDLILFQDADLEYSPDDYSILLAPFYKFNADVVYGSRLTRAKSTAEAAMKKGEWKCPITFNEIIYFGSTNDLLILIKEQNDKYDSICLVGHEPKFSNFVDLSTNKEHTQFSTATIAKINFNLPKWSLIEFGFGNLDWLISPNELN